MKYFREIRELENLIFARFGGSLANDILNGEATIKQDENIQLLDVKQLFDSATEQRQKVKAKIKRFKSKIKALESEFDDISRLCGVFDTESARGEIALAWKQYKFLNKEAFRLYDLYLLKLTKADYRASYKDAI